MILDKSVVAPVWSGLLRVVVPAGIGAGVLSLAVLMICSALRGDWPLSALNATAHWAFGTEAAQIKELRADVTGLGLATHVAAAFFWAAVYAVAIRMLQPKRTTSLLLVAAGVALMAAILDYLILPRSMSPGWHLVLGPAGVAAAFAALGAGLFLGTSLVRTARS
jgi:hypothetical protein